MLEKGLFMYIIKKRLTFCLLFVLVAFLIFLPQYTFAAEKLDDKASESTVYGNIPNEWADKNRYPFVLFASEKAVFASSSWSEVIIKANADYLNSDTAEVVLLVRADVSENSMDYNNWSYIRGSLTIDLGQNTLSVEKNLFKPNDKSKYDTNITVKNGNILLKGNSKLIYYASSATEENGAIGSEFNITFIKTNIGFDAGATSKELVSTMGQSGKLPVKSNLGFINCNIDLQTNAPDNNLTFLNLSSDLQNHSTIVTIDGGSIAVKNSAFVLASLNKNATAPDSLTFTSDISGKYTDLILPIGEELPESMRNINGGELLFVKTSENSKNQMFSLLTAMDISLMFRPKSSITLGSELVYNVYIPVAEHLESFSLDGVEYVKGDALLQDTVTANGLEYYLITIPLPSAEAVRSIPLEVSLKIGNNNSRGIWTLSLLKYAKAVIEEGNNELEVTLVKDTLAYVRSAYVYFDKDDRDSALAQIDEIIGGYNGSHGISSRDSKSTGELKAATFAFDSKPVVKLYIEDGFKAKDYKFFSNGKKITDITVGSDADGRYVLLNLYAYQMCSDITYTVKGETSGAYSINNYYSYIVKNKFKDEKKEALLDLVRKFYNYSQSSADYYISYYADDTSNIEVDLSEYDIVYPYGASDDIIGKAQKLASKIESKTGKEISVLSDREISDCERIITVGNSQLTREYIILKLSKHDSEDAFMFDFSEDSIVVMGKTEASSLRAVEYFIEHYVDTLSEKETVVNVPEGGCDIKTFMNVDGVDIVIENVSTVFEVTSGVNTNGLYPSRVSTAHYPSIIELDYNGENNGKLLAIFRLGDTATVEGVTNTNACVMESTDGGESWRMIARPIETIDPSIPGISMAHLYELPKSVGDMPAGTILYSGNSVDYDTKSHIAIWRSFDCGYTWEEYVVIAEGDAERGGVWEPFVWYEESDGYLYCFYSDDSDPIYDQKLVYKRSLDGVNWSDAVEVCAFDGAKDRPGMFIMTQMSNGEYFMVYEYYGTGKGQVYYKTTLDVSEWGKDEVGTLLIDENGYTVKGGPYCIWTPYGSENGILFATGKEDLDGGQRHLLFVSFDYGTTWTTMENPLPYDITISTRGTNRVGHSPSFIVSSDSSVIYYVNTTVVAETGYQRIEFAKMKIYTNS